MSETYTTSYAKEDIIKHPQGHIEEEKQGICLLLGHTSFITHNITERFSLSRCLRCNITIKRKLVKL